MSSPAELVASALLPLTERVPLPQEPVHGTCAVTGREGPCIRRKDAIGGNFTTQGIFAAPNSDLVGVETYQALKWKWQRMSSWICDGRQFVKLRRPDVRRAVLEGPEGFFDSPPERWAAYCTTSYKKHGILVARVNAYPRSALWAFDDVLVDCSDGAAVRAMYTRLCGYLESGIGRPALESRHPNVATIKRSGISTWLDFEKWSADKWRSPLYRFVCYLLPSIEERKNAAAGSAADA